MTSKQLTDAELDGIVAGLSNAQRAFIGEKSVWKQPTSFSEKRWMTFPPRSTHRALMHKALVDGSGQLSELGQAVRSHLLKETK